MPAITNYPQITNPELAGVSGVAQRPSIVQTSNFSGPGLQSNVVQCTSEQVTGGDHHDKSGGGHVSLRVQQHTTTTLHAPSSTMATLQPSQDGGRTAALQLSGATHADAAGGSQPHTRSLTERHSRTRLSKQSPAEATASPMDSSPLPTQTISLNKQYPPMLTLFVNGPGCAQTLKAQSILKSIGWAAYVHEINVEQDPARLEFLASIVEKPSVPFLFFQGKHVGNLEQITKHLASNSSWGIFHKLSKMHDEWINSSFSAILGSEYGFHLYLDRMLLSDEAAAMYPSDRPWTHDERSIEMILPKFKAVPPPVEGSHTPSEPVCLSLTEILRELLLAFSFEHVKTNKPTCSTFALIPGRRTHRRSFSGTTLTEFLASHFNLDMAYVISICQILMDFLILRQVEKKEIQLFMDGPLLYRFATHDNPMTLNKLMVFPRRRAEGAPNMAKLVENLCATMARIRAAHTKVLDNGTIGIDLKAAFNDQDFLNFRIAVCELTSCNVDELFQEAKNVSDPAAAEKAERTIRMIFLNLFNLCVYQAFVQVGVPASTVGKVSFFNKVGYQIGPEELSMNQMLHGILRANRRAVGSNRSLQTTHPYVLDRADPRIHFCVQDGYKILRKDHIFTEENLERILQESTVAYCMDNANVRIELTPAAAKALGIEVAKPYTAERVIPECGTSNTPGPSNSKKNHRIAVIWLARLFQVYGVDFGNTPLEIATRLCSWLAGDKREVMECILEKHRLDIVSLSVQQMSYTWEPSEMGIGNYGRFPFTEENR